MTSMGINMTQCDECFTYIKPNEIYNCPVCRYVNFCPKCAEKLQYRCNRCLRGELKTLFNPKKEEDEKKEE